VISVKHVVEMGAVSILIFLLSMAVVVAAMSMLTVKNFFISPGL